LPGCYQEGSKGRINSKLPVLMQKR
jgi:hypothetical protein